MVKITVEGNTPLEALSSLAAFGMHCMTNEDVYRAATRILEAEKHKEAKEAAAQAAALAAEPSPVANTAPQKAPDPEPGPTTTSSPSEGTVATSGPTAVPSDAPGDGPVPTVEEVRAKGVEASRKYGKDAVVALLKEFGASGMSAIAEKDRAAFLKKLEGLGGADA